MRVTHNAFICYDTISRAKNWRILKHTAFFQEMLQKVILERKKQMFLFKMVCQYAQEAFL